LDVTSVNNHRDNVENGVKRMLYQS
jgi:hypothetical protein